MSPNPVPLRDDRLDMLVEGDDFGVDADFFDELPGQRGGHRLADFDAAARQAEMAEQRRPRPAHDEDTAVSKDRRRNREDRAGRNNRSFIDRPPRA